VFAHWKTTANGFLAAIIGAAGPATAWLATVHSPKAATATGVVTLIAGIARVWIGILQNDAPPVSETATITVASATAPPPTPPPASEKGTS
jgi:hypothetical protein